MLASSARPAGNSPSSLTAAAEHVICSTGKADSSVTSPTAVDVAQGVAALASQDDGLTPLMVRYQEGDAAAFRELFEELHRPLRGYIIGLTRDLARAEDLLQETLLQFHRSRHTYRPPRPVRPWAFGIARHVFLMDRRAAGRRMRVFDENLELPPDLPVPPGVLGLEDRDAVRGALGKLAEDQREILLLHHVWGFSFAEIARTLGIRAGTAKVRAHRAIARVRRLIGVEGER